MMVAAMLGFAAMTLLAVVAGELTELPWRRLADAGRSRMPAPSVRSRR